MFYCWVCLLDSLAEVEIDDGEDSSDFTTNVVVISVIVPLVILTFGGVISVVICRYKRQGKRVQLGLCGLTSRESTDIGEAV